MGAPSEFRAQVRREVLAALEAADDPLTNRELRERCPSARHGDDISLALNVLKAKGRISAGESESRQRIYWLPKLGMEHQETTMHSGPDDEFDHLMADFSESAPLTSATGSDEGDEYRQSMDANIVAALERMAHEPISYGSRLADELAFDPEVAVSSITWNQRQNEVIGEETTLTLSLMNPGGGTFPALQTSGRFALESAEALRRLADIIDALVVRHDAVNVGGDYGDE